MSTSPSTSQKENDDMPIIGISGMRMPDDSAEFFTMDKTQIHYVGAVEKVGGVPISLPVLENFNPKIIKKQIGIIDALIIQGGLDVIPTFYGEEKKPELDKTDFQTDNFLFELIKQAIERKIPILGICKGMQILNVAFGGTLYQDLKYAGLDSQSHRQDINSMCSSTHSISVVKDSLLSKIIPGQETLQVNSYHHQAVKDLGKGFVIDAKSHDGIIESIHLNDEKQWILGVQFHPEQLIRVNDVFLPIFKELINQANIRKSKGI